MTQLLVPSYDVDVMTPRRPMTTKYDGVLGIDETADHEDDSLPATKRWKMHSEKINFKNKIRCSHELILIIGCHDNDVR